MGRAHARASQQWRPGLFLSNRALSPYFLFYYVVCWCTCRCGTPRLFAVADSTSSRMLWFSFAEAVILVALSIWRVVSIRNFFEQRSSF